MEEQKLPVVEEVDPSTILDDSLESEIDGLDLD